MSTYGDTPIWGPPSPPTPTGTSQSTGRSTGSPEAPSPDAVSLDAPSTGGPSTGGPSTGGPSPDAGPLGHGPLNTSQSNNQLHTRVEPFAVAAFVLSLFSLAVFIIPAIVALFMSSAASRNIKASNGHRTGKGFAIAARAISCTTLFLTLVIALILYFH